MMSGEEFREMGGLLPPALYAPESIKKPEVF